MNIVQMASFTVLGREARTSNAKEMSGQGVIGAMWSRGVPEGPVFAVYSKYESDKDGAYSYLLGRRTDGNETLPMQVDYCIIQPGPYWQLGFDGSISPEAVVGLWRQVWEAEQSGKIQRAYKTDFESYGETGFELYIGLKG